MSASTIGRPVAELAAVVHLGGDSRHLLEQELADEPGVPARPAGQEHHPPHVLEPLGGLAQLLEMDAALFEADPSEQAVAHRARLLVDLLQHEVAIAALLGLHRIPGDALGSTGDHGPRRVLEGHRVGAHGHDLAVLQEQEVAGVGEEGGNVRGEEVLAVAEAHHQGWPETSADQGLGLVLVQQHQGVDSLELGHRSQQGRFERALVVVGHEVGDHLRVRLGHEHVARGLQPGLQGKVVLDDAVVDHDDASGRVLVGMRILLRGPAVGRPTRVAHPVVTRERLLLQAQLQVLQLARGAPALEHAVAHHRHPGRVVAAVLELAQALDDDRHRIARAHVSHDPAHVSASLRPRP